MSEDTPPAEYWRKFDEPQIHLTISATQLDDLIAGDEILINVDHFISAHPIRISLEPA